MWLTRTQVFVESRGDRPDITNLAIIITDGVPTREESTYFDEVYNLRVCYNSLAYLIPKMQ